MKLCKEVVETFEEEVQQTIEKWIEEVREVCKDLPWPLDWFCEAVTFLVKVVEVIVVTIVKVVVTVVCYPVVLALTLVGEAINVLLTVPVVGTLIKWILGAAAWVVSQTAGVFDAIAGLAGLRPLKHLRLHIVILMRDDRTLTVPADRVDLVVQRTAEIFRSRADVKLHTTVHTVSTPSPRNALYVDSGVGLLGEDMTGAGVYFQWTITEMLWEHNWLFATRIGAPIVAFIVDGVGTTEIGCSSGPLADYVCVEGGRMLVPPQTQPVVPPVPSQPPGSTTAAAPTTLAHELGHACGLLHDKVHDCTNGDVTNLMYCSPQSPAGVARGDNLSPFQRAVVRSSPHVTYL